MPRKYRLLKDLPGCPEGTVYTLVDGRYFSERELEMRDECGRKPCMHVGPFPKHRVENEPDWFSPITEPERPYPWEPMLKEEYWMADAMDKRPQNSFTNDGNRVDKQVIANNAAFRTKEDAELALKGLPLYNRAVKAICNKRTCLPVEGDRVFYVSRDATFMPFTVRSSVLGANDAVRGDEFFYKEDAQAIADLFNLCLNTGSNGE